MLTPLNIDFSGRRGLLERYQGDLNDTTSQQNLRYTGGEGEYANGIFDPMKVLGYMSPSNAKFATLTGTTPVSSINSMQYDAFSDTAFMSEDGINILQLSGLDDTTLANYLTVTSGYTIKDSLLYEVNGSRALIYAIDSNDFVLGSFVGFKSLDTGTGAGLLNNNIESAGITPRAQYAFTDATGGAPKVTQSFISDDVPNLVFNLVRWRLRLDTWSGPFNIKVTLQAGHSASTSPYTARGAWAALTAYAINDTVTNGGQTYQCWAAHTSSAAGAGGDEPGVGSSYLTKWNIFGAPSGTALATSSNFLVSSTTLTFGDSQHHQDVYFQFPTPFTMTAGTQYWLVLEESGTSGNLFSVEGVASDGGSSPYTNGIGGKKLVNAATDYWYQIDGANEESWDFGIYSNRVDNWTSTVASGEFVVPTGQTPQWLYLADNGLVYWFVKNKVHVIDGGATGGIGGRIVEEALSFPSYTSVADVAETNSRMYIGVQSSNITTATDPRTFTGSIAGVYVWNRRSQLTNGGDFYPMPGVKEIKKLFQSSDGTVKAITVNNSGFTEIRGATGSQFGVLHTLEKDAYPHSRKSVSQIDDMTVWLGANGYFYGYGAVAAGEKDALYKLGYMGAEAGVGFASGSLLVGHKETTEPRSGIFYSWTDTTPAYKVQKWYPHGDGTINSVDQTGNQGNVYSQVYEFPSPIWVNYAHLFGAPIPDDGAGNSTTIGTVKVYLNKSASVSNTFTVTRKDMLDGFMFLPIDKKDVFAIQFEIEWSTTQTLGTYDLQPSRITAYYAETRKMK